MKTRAKSKAAPKGKAKPKAAPKRQAKPKKAGNLRARFVDEYMLDQNATQAAIRAGYSPASAATTGYRLLKDAEICAEISRRTSQRSTSLGITADRIMQEYARLALLDPLDLFNADGSMKALKDIPEDARRAIGGLEIRELKDIETPDGLIAATLKKIKLIDKKGALDSLAKILGMLKEQVEVDVRGGVLLIPAPIDPKGWEEAARANQAALKEGKVG